MKSLRTELNRYLYDGTEKQFNRVASGSVGFVYDERLAYKIYDDIFKLIDTKLFVIRVGCERYCQLEEELL